MCVPSLNEICESVFHLSCTQVKTCSAGGGGSGEMDVKPVYLKLLSWDIITTSNMS